jgi:TatD DNase family protein
MHDSHCHVDAYRCPEDIANAAESAGVFTIAVTNLPSAFAEGEPHLRGFRHVKLATGLHPLLAQHHTPAQRRLFVETLERTGFVGEIGLDYSQQGRSSRDAQIRTLEFVLDHLVGRGKFATLHSRRAEGDVRRMLADRGITPVVFHWYSGALGELERILGDGHYLSINPRMLISKNGAGIVERIPRDRALLETDGPFCKMRGRELVPADTATVCEKLAELWNVSSGEAEAQLDGNLKRAMNTT